MSTLTATTTAPRRGAHQSVLAAMWTGLALTVAALALPHLDRVTTGLLANHIRTGYPDLAPSQIDAAVTTYLVALSVVGALGILGWLGSLWLARRTPRWAPVVSSLLWITALGIALFALTVTDTSGDTGLPPLLGWAGVVPCLAGLVAVVQQWRHR